MHLHFNVVREEREEMSDHRTTLSVQKDRQWFIFFDMAKILKKLHYNLPILHYIAFYVKQNDL